MKRKVIFMGGKTAVISLPAPWIKRYNIHKGDELDLQEKSNEILIKTINENSVIKRIIDTRKINDSSMIWNFIPAAYISGVDEIEIYFKGIEQKKIIEQCVSTLIGFGIIDEKEDYIYIKDSLVINLNGLLADSFSVKIYSIKYNLNEKYLILRR